MKFSPLMPTHWTTVGITAPRVPTNALRKSRRNRSDISTYFTASFSCKLTLTKRTSVVHCGYRGSTQPEPTFSLKPEHASHPTPTPYYNYTYTVLNIRKSTLRPRGHPCPLQHQKKVHRLSSVNRGAPSCHTPAHIQRPTRI